MAQSFIPPLLQQDTQSVNYGLTNQVSPETALAEQALNRRQQIAQLLLQQGLKGMPEGKMVGRFYVPPSPLQGLSSLAQAGVGMYLTSKNDEARQALGEKERSGLQAALAEYQKGMAPTTTEGPRPTAQVAPQVQAADPFAGIMPQPAQAPVSTELPGPGAPVSTPATPDAQRQALVNLMASQYPQARSVGSVLAQQQFQGEQRGEQRDFLKAEGELNRQNRLDTQQAGMGKDIMLATAMGANKETIQGMKDTLERYKADLAARTAEKVAGMRGDAQRDVADKKVGAGRPVPSAVGSKFMENSQNLRMAENALGLISGQSVGGSKGDPNATGMKGYLPDALLQRMDPSGVETRAAVSNLGSMIIHDRSGAAVTASEYPRLRPFIPTASDDPTTVKKKLGQFVNEYRKINDEMTQFYTESGYNVPQSNWHQPSTSQTVTPTLPSGAKQIGTSQGKPVYQLPDGSKVVAE